MDFQKGQVLMFTGDAHFQDIHKFTVQPTETQSDRLQSTLLALRGEMIIPPDYCHIPQHSDWKTYLVADADMLDLRLWATQNGLWGYMLLIP